MKLFEHHKAEKTVDRLPELPSGVEVPDDISGLRPPTTLKPTAGGVRWMRWLAAIVVLGAAGVLAALLLTGGDDATETETAQVETGQVATQAEADLGAIDYMATYGTDNPVFLVANDYMATYGTDNPVFVVANDYMELYGTDNPVLVRAATFADSDEFLGTFGTVDTGRYLELYGTDNPVFVRAVTADLVANPIFVAPNDYLELYGTDNPVFVPEAAVVDTPDTGQYLELYGTDNPVFVAP